ncbi:hypothetical protein E4198_21070 [Streptomyces sp. RKND-216]|uniref:hypothetical protein n=1 Tax=Streptomyces sp. RKND-216 TaxID=2562581 RepID=UPI00109D8CFE|nr:hypothetical protein [Streptomyces sp. RKND-216]THA26821.1 hypothetical protein E4198_21070 [Streptomyces sp. RKND-216]
MAEATAGEKDERVLGRRWTVRLDAAGRGTTAVRVSCSRPACPAQGLPSAAAGREAAVAHLREHLQAAPGPRADAYCACRAEDCAAHIAPTEGQRRAEPWRCGGAVVLAVVSDRGGRWWQALECCTRCAAALPRARTVATSAVATSAVGSAPGSDGQAAADDRPRAAAVGTPHFSDGRTPAGGPPARAAREVPAPRPAPARRRQRGKIAQRSVPPDLRPVVLRDELIELGNLFRRYQRRTEPDLAVLGDLHERKARAFIAWAQVTGDPELRAEAERAEQSAATVRMQHRHRNGERTEEDEPAVARLLTAPGQWEQARAVLAHVAGHTPLPGAQARLLVLMLTLRTAHSGTGNLVGQDLAGLGLDDPEALAERLTDCGWLRLPGTASDLLASRPESPTPVTVPSLVPGEDASAPFTFGKKARAKLSGWGQRVVSDKKLRKRKAPAPVRLLALTLATRTDADGLLGAGDEGLPLESLLQQVPVEQGELPGLVDRLTQADWLTDAALTDSHLTGRLTERVLPLTCPLV